METLRPSFALLGACLAGAISVASGCSDDAGTGGGSCSQELGADGCFDYACYTEGQARSFRTDVLPIFENSCSLAASCHGDPASPAQAAGYRPYLGEVSQETTPSDVPKILSLIVGQDSRAASMKIVDPGKPESSFLMHKMDGDLECASVTCSGSCGTPMPQTGDILPREQRDIVRDWIKQGAQDN
jgi:hypothetical protein